MKTRTIMAGVVASALLTTSALAGGFERGRADTELLFDGQGLSSRAGVTIVNPQREYTSVRPFVVDALGNGAVSFPADGFENPSYVIPSVAAAYGFDRGSCGGTYTTPFGGNSNFERFSVDASAVGGPDRVPLGFNPTSTTATTKVEFITHEFGLTCQAGAEVGPGRAFGLAGAFVQTLDFEQTVALGGRVLDLDDTSYGYRLGVGYEVPEIALRAQLIYRSEVDIDAEGSFRVNDPTLDAFAAATGGANTTGATGTGTFPRSLEFRAQSGIAADTLVFLTAKWTDWSVFDRLEYNTALPETVNIPGLGPVEVPGSGDQQLEFYYRDGYTIGLGVARRLNETTAATLGVAWDRGVGTGYDIATDTYTLAAGAVLTPREDIEITFGGALLYLTGGEQRFFNANGVVDANGREAERIEGDPVLEADDDIGFALSLAGKIRF